MEDEKVDISFTGDVSIEKLPSKIPENTARYHIFNYAHSYEGEQIKSIGKFCISLQIFETINYFST